MQPRAPKPAPQRSMAMPSTCASLIAPGVTSRSPRSMKRGGPGRLDPRRSKPCRTGSLYHKRQQRRGEVSMPMVTVHTLDGAACAAYLALPAHGTGPGIVVIQEIFGVDQVMRDITDWYAARGFVAICPDLFWRQEPGVQLTDQSEAEWQHALQLYQGLDEAKAVADTAAAMAFVRQHPACTGKVGGVGFCLGGKLAYLLAARAAPDCAVGYYGVGIESALHEAPHIRCPLLLHIATQDQFCPPAAQAQMHQVLDGHPRVTLHDYTQQDHAFARPGGAHYNAAAAELANLRTLEVLVRALGLGSDPTAQRLTALWEEHIRHEFATRNTMETLATIVPHAYVNHIPVLTRA